MKIAEALGAAREALRLTKGGLRDLVAEREKLRRRRDEFKSMRPAKADVLATVDLMIDERARYFQSQFEERAGYLIRHVEIVQRDGQVRSQLPLIGLPQAGVGPSSEFLELGMVGLFPDLVREGWKRLVDQAGFPDGPTLAERNREIAKLDREIERLTREITQLEAEARQVISEID